MPNNPKPPSLTSPAPNVPKVDVVIDAKTGHVNLTPYALARMADSFFESSEAYSSNILLFNYFMRCASIELGFKAAVLSQDNSQAMKDYLAKRNGHKNGVGHDLVKAHAVFVGRFSEILTPDEADALKRINPYFKGKGLEYVTLDVIVQLANGLSDFPAMGTIRSASVAVNEFLKAHQFFIGA